MSKLLSELLGAEEPLFTMALRDLEKASGNPSADVRLTAEIVGQVKIKTQELGLDPDDTTGKELYYALLNRVHDDNERIITQLLDLPKGTEDIATLVPPMVKVVKSSNIPKKCWALKRSVAKRMLKKMPPKAMMSHLGYRSIDSMLKHEPFFEMYTALRFSEGAEWLAKFNELLKTVKPKDFEERTIEIIQMDNNKWVELSDAFTKKKLHNVTHSKEMGVVVVVPMKRKTMRGLPLKTMSLLFHYINEIRLYSAFFKFISTRPTFGADMVTTINADPKQAAVMAGQHIHWRVIQQYLGRHKDTSHPEAFQPHVQPEDLHWRKAEESLYELDEKLEFWRDLDYVARRERGGPVALNLMDVAFAYSNEEHYEDRYYYHFRESLWNEIFIRYMSEKNLEQQVLEQLDNDMIAPEKLEVI